MNTEFRAVVPDNVSYEAEHILATVAGSVFFNENGDALILGDDHTWVVRVHHDTQLAYTESAWLSTQPIETYLGPKENEHVLTEEDLPELKGFEGGFSA